jgi:glycosyltransferase involved in cell wall biosynthesis
MGALLAQADFEVEAIATTATEGYVGLTRSDWPELGPRNAQGVRRFDGRGVQCAVLDTGDRGAVGWEATHGAAYNTLYTETLSRFKPHLVFTYGCSTAALERRRRARASGARVVLGLYCAHHLEHRHLDHTDLVITPSEFLSRFYRTYPGIRSRSLPTPLWPDDVLAEHNDPVYLTMVNPSFEKGLMFFACLTAALGVQYPDIPIQVYPSRGGPSLLVQSAMVAGVDLSQHPSLTFHPTVPVPSKIYRRARVLIVPSLDEDAAPRVVAEAFVNGVPPIGSDRGGIPEMCADGGFVLPLPRSIDPRRPHAVAAEVLHPWIGLIAHLFRSATAWQGASERARRAGELYLPSEVTEHYVDCFQSLLNADSSPSISDARRGSSPAPPLCPHGDLRNPTLSPSGRLASLSRIDGERQSGIVDRPTVGQTIAINLIGTGDYRQLGIKLIPQLAWAFLPDYDRQIFFHTDRELSMLGVTYVHAEHLPAPLASLLRYHRITSIRDRLSEFDFVFYIDVDVRFEGVLAEEILNRFTVVKHWMYPNEETSRQAPWESNKTSTAWFSRRGNEQYYHGSFQGGEASAFLAAADEIRAWIERDLCPAKGSTGYIPSWFDETYFNRFANRYATGLAALPPKYSQGPREHSRAPSLLSDQPLVTMLPEHRKPWGA